MNGTAGSPGKKLLTQSVFIFLIALTFSWTIGESIFGRLLARWTLDQFIRWDRPTGDDQIVLIDITEDDYGNRFNRRRPLDPEKIVELINAAHTAGAKAIAVDISTADWPKEAKEQLRKLPFAAIIWARDFYEDRQGGKPTTVLEPLLGGLKEASGECYGVPALGEEAGVVRYFYSGLRIGGLREPSFVSQIVYRSENSSCLQPEDQDEERQIISFSSQIPSESASTLLDQAGQKDFGSRPEYAGKILIIGGSFHSGADTKLTPVGAMSGLEIIGQALSSVTKNRARRELGKGYSVLIDSVIGLVLFLLGLLGWRVQVLTTIVFVLPLGIACLYAFRQYDLFVSFIPFVAGIFAHAYLARLHGLS
jgi:CHASE2 domain-containing sensor protein